MRERLSSQAKARVVSLAGLIGVALMVLSIQGGGPLRSAPASAVGSGPEMALTVRDGGFCVANDCYAAVGESFQFSVDIVTAPAEGYVMFQAYVWFGGAFNGGRSEDGAGPGTCFDGLDNGDPPDGKDFLDSDCTTVGIPYIPAALDEEFTWPDVNLDFALRGRYVHASSIHGAISGFDPLVESMWEGEVLSLRMSCPATPAQATISLKPYGAIFFGTMGTVLADIDGVQTIPKLNTITMNCSDNDTDGDGCSDVAEHGPDPLLGGDRDWLNPWDFYDVASPGGVPIPDGVVDLPNDILGVLQHQGSAPGPPYDVQYDRGPAAGPSWNGTQPPDGVIDLPNDVLGVIAQFNHSCV